MNMKRIEHYLRRNFPNVSLLDAFCVNQMHFMERSKREICDRQKTKFERSFQEQQVPIQLNEKAVKNLTDTDLPVEAELILSMGPKTALPVTYDTLPITSIIAEVENTISYENLHTEQQIRVRNKAVNIISNHIHRIRKTPLHESERFLLNCYDETAKFLNRHKSDRIMVCKADKGNVTVIMKIDDYEEKMGTLVNDQNTYKCTTDDPFKLTKTMENKNKALLIRLEKDGYIDSYTRNRLTAKHSNPPRIYGMPKIHKNGTPLRPVVSTIGSPAYALSGYLSKILGNIIDGEWNVPDSFKFAEWLRNVAVPDGYVLASLDVTSLFTNVSVERACGVIKKKWNTIRHYTKIPSDRFINLVRFCMIDCAYFSYQGKTYKQIFGTAMGSPLAATIANLVMDDLMDVCISAIDVDILFMKKYVDDFLVAIRPNDLNGLITVFKEYDEHIDFTHEEEENGSINFLDINIKHDHNGGLILDWYTKPMCSNRILNFRSSHKYKTKLNTAYGFINRVLSISDVSLHEMRIADIKRILKINSYPLTIIDKLIQRFCDAKNSTVPKIRVDNVDARYTTMTYIRGMSEQLEKLFGEHLTNTKIAYKYARKVDSLFTVTKDRISDEKKSNVIYEIPCKDCSTVYIGQTGRRLEDRMKEHKNDMKKALGIIGDLLVDDNTPATPTRARNTNRRRSSNRRSTSPILSPGNTALKTHCYREKHFFDFENVKILDTEPILRKRCLKESCLIMLNNNNCNFRTDTENIHGAYIDVIHRMRPQNDVQLNVGTLTQTTNA